MRLPTVNRQQELAEDVRAFHEQLWALYQSGGRLAYPVTEDEIAARRHYRRQMNFTDFWYDRGYRIRCKLTKDRRFVEMWLDKKPTKQKGTSAPVDYITCQPASWVA